MEPPAQQLGRSDLCTMVAGSMVTPRSGANSTATIQLTISETAITTKSEKVNSPAAELFSDGDEARHRHQRAGQHREGDGTPGMAGGAFQLSPTSSREIIVSMAIIASSTSSPRAMISAPSEIRCNVMP